MYETRLFPSVCRHSTAKLSLLICSLLGEPEDKLSSAKIDAGNEVELGLHRQIIGMAPCLSDMAYLSSFLSSFILAIVTKNELD